MEPTVYLFPLLAVLLGYVIAIYFEPKNKKNLKLLLAFSGAFLLSLTVMHLLPEVYEADLHHEAEHHHEHKSALGVFIMLGIVFQIILEYLSKGAEHGHVHSHEPFKKMPWVLFFSLCLHALLEGMPIHQHNHLAVGIAIHHFPIAIILTTFFRQAKLPKKALFVFMVGFALMTPIGTYLSGHLPFLIEYYAPISGIVIGILFHISSTIIFESSEGHTFNLAKISVILLGILLAYFI
jgi:zinc transporter ZupT